MKIFKKLTKLFKKFEKNRNKLKKIMKKIKKLFVIFLMGAVPFLTVSENGGKLYGYNIFRKTTKPDSKDTRTDSDKTDAGKNEEYYNKLQSRIEEELKNVYKNPSPSEALKHMVWIEVPVWRLKDGKKVSDREKIQVLNLLADEVKEIFKEIYNGKEKFPIKYLNGYSWRGSLKSLHSTGRAIDINPEENPQVSSEGKAIVGKKWEPRKNPYSITPDGDVVKAFTKRGWTWGEKFRRPDYMHFGFKEW